MEQLLNSRGDNGQIPYKRPIRPRQRQTRPPEAVGRYRDMGPCIKPEKCRVKQARRACANAGARSL